MLDRVFSPPVGFGSAARKHKITIYGIWCAAQIEEDEAKDP